MIMTIILVTMMMATMKMLMMWCTSHISTLSTLTPQGSVASSSPAWWEEAALATCIV